MVERLEIGLWLERYSLSREGFFEKGSDNSQKVSVPLYKVGQKFPVYFYGLQRSVFGVGGKQKFGNKAHLLGNQAICNYFLVIIFSAKILTTILLPFTT